MRAAPGVRKAVRWNPPGRGVEGQGEFVRCHVFSRDVKVTFLNGAALRPLPPGSGKNPDARWVDIHEGEIDEARMAEWVRQAAAIPGWPGFRGPSVASRLVTARSQVRIWRAHQDVLNS